MSGATAWTNPTDQETIILIFHECLYFGKSLDHSLINPNQIRHNGIDYWDNPYDASHELSIVVDGDFSIPLRFHGTKLVFNSRVPTAKELDTCRQVEMTSIIPWEPHEVHLGQVQSKAQPSPPFYRCINKVWRSCDQQPLYQYNNTGNDEAILHSIEPTLVALGELASNIYDPSTLDIPVRRTFISGDRHVKLNANKLAELWCIGTQRAQATMMATTQHGIRSALLPISRRYRSDRMHNIKRLNGKFATDTFYAETKSLNQNIGAQIYSHKIGFSVCYPLQDAKSETLAYTLNNFISDYGAPERLTFDGAQAQAGKHTEFMQCIRRHHIKHHISAPRRPNENPAEAAIREVKKRWYRIMKKKRVPRRLWDFAITWICETGNLTVSSSRYADGRTPIEIITGETPDISEYVDFSFYDWIVYRINAGLGEQSIGRWLGVSHKVGQLMSYWVLTVSGHVVSATTVQRLTNAAMQTDEWMARMTEYDNNIKTRLDVANAAMPLNDIDNWNQLSLPQLDEEFLEEFNKVINDESIPHADYEPTPDACDQFINMELGMPRGPDGELQHATVKKRAIDIDGRPIGIEDKNPLLDSRKYVVEYIDGTTEVISANIIAENILSQVDEEGHRQLLIDEIIDHRKDDNAVPRERGLYETKDGTLRRKMTTKGWELCVIWKDGSTNWVELKDLKNSYPIQLAEYAINNEIDKEPAFAWWVPYTIKKRKSIISKIKTKYWQRTHKFGIRIPKSVKEAYEIDAENGDTVWRDAVRQEMKKIREAFQKYDGNPHELIGYQQITTHFIFDIKMGEGFRRKARLVADGHKTKTPASVTYSSVVSRDSVRICLLVAALNDLDIESADIENAYLTAPCREKCWTIGGDEFGSDAGSAFIIVKALYGLKSSGAAFRAFLAETLDEIGFKSSEADPDVWLRAAVKADGEEYYEYILVYVDDILCISHKAKETMSLIAKDFRFKNDVVKPPEIYLGARLEKKQLNDKEMWTMSSTDYLKAAVKNVEERLAKKGMKLRSKIEVPMPQGYHPEIDASDELNSDGVTMYQELIGMLRWAVEIGRVDILTELSLLSAYQASPRQGHLEHLIDIFAYVKKHPKITIYFDPTPARLDESTFQGNTTEQFKEYYRDAEEQLPHRMPKPRGRSVHMTAFVDASHAANKVNRRSHTGFLIFLNRAPIIWYSKRQNTVESSTFSSEFIAMKACMESITSMRFKLRMFGVPIEGPANVLCDNQSVVNNTSKIESVLNKKHSSIAYHAVRWSVAAGVLRVGKVDTNDNLADAMTKILSSIKRKFLFGNWTY